MYLRLLDEDIIIEEVPTSKLDQRKISFVYEEFMEYVLAEEVFQRMIRQDRQQVDIVFGQLNEAVPTFVNALGVGEYLVAFCLDERMYKFAFELVTRMGESGSVWDNITLNIFKKYDQSIEMIIECEWPDIEMKPKRIEALWNRSGGRHARY